MSNKLINFYATIKDEKRINPNYDIHKLNLPFRAIICTASGGGKTNLLMNILYEFNNTFHKIIVITKAEEPLYDKLKEKLKDEVDIHYDGKTLDATSLPKLEKNENGLIVYDDMVLSQDKSIGEMFIRARKLGYSSIFISQSYFQISKLIRQNCNYIWLGRGILDRDLKMIISEYSINIDKDRLIHIYHHITSKKMYFMLIDLDDRTIRENIKTILIKF